jgi:type I restriction enzyme, S subunit
VGVSNETIKAAKPPVKNLAKLDSTDLPEWSGGSEVEVIPQGWQLQPVSQMGEVLIGKALAVNAPGQLRPYLRTKNVFDGCIDIEDVLKMPMTDEEFGRFRLRLGDVLLNEGQSLELVGRCAIYRNEYPEPCAIQNQLLRFRAREEVCADFAAHLFRFCQQTGVFARIALQTTSIAHLGGTRFERLRLPWPKHEEEQRAIAEALSDVDRLLGALEALIAKKRDMNQAAMQQLLTGKTRLAGFSGTWERKKIIEIASLCGERNSPAKDLPVLTCSKHLGFVDSLGYFKNQVFSKDLSGYKIIRRGQIGYPANHIEEGSIGLQDLYDVAVVSPIYVVFEPAFGVSSYFLHRLLKLDSYQQMFATATNSSVDRRGSLRWPAFSEITIELPPNNEQERIAKVLSDMDAEIGVLEARLDKTRAIKQGMMQQLLTGRIRLVKPQPAEAEA